MSALGAVVARLEARFGERLTRAAPSAPLTTYRCGGPLAALVRVGSDDEAAAVADAVVGTEVAVLVVGRGSNLLIADGGFEGLAILLDGEFESVGVSRTAGRVRAGAAVPLPVLARRATAGGVSGLEFYVGIPGTLGGAVRMNAGGHGRETRDVLVSARVLSLHDGADSVRPVAELGLGYRRSALDDRSVVLSADLRGEPGDAVAGAARIDEIVRWRREHQPGGQNAGSVFTNPPGDAAGRLIEASGCKGMRVGGVVVSPKHANFFVAEPGARAADVVALIREVRRRVEHDSGITLDPELQLVGFEEGDGDREASR